MPPKKGGDKSKAAGKAGKDDDKGAGKEKKGGNAVKVCGGRGLALLGMLLPSASATFLT